MNRSLSLPSAICRLRSILPKATELLNPHQQSLCTIPEPADQDGDRWNDIAATELEKEVETFYEDGDKLVLASLSCSPPPQGFMELSPTLETEGRKRDDASRPNTRTPDVGKEQPMQ